MPWQLSVGRPLPWGFESVGWAPYQAWSPRGRTSAARAQVTWALHGAQLFSFRSENELGVKVLT